MKRYVLGPLAGAGTEEAPYIHKACTYFHSGGCATIATPEKGEFQSLALFIGTQTEVNALAGDAQLTILPWDRFDLDTRWMSLGNNSQRTNISNAIRTRTNSRAIIPRDDPRTLREVLAQIGRVFDPTFDPEVLDAPDVP